MLSVEQLQVPSKPGNGSHEGDVRCFGTFLQAVNLQPCVVDCHEDQATLHEMSRWALDRKLTSGTRRSSSAMDRALQASPSMGSVLGSSVSGCRRVRCLQGCGKRSEGGCS